MAYYESHFALLFQDSDKRPSDAEKVFSQTAPDLPPVARFVSGLLIGFALGAALGILIPGLGWLLGGAIGMLVATPMTLAYPALSIFASTLIGDKPKTTPLNLPAHLPIYLRLSAGCVIGAVLGGLMGCLIPGGILLGLAIGILVGAGLGCLSDLLPVERPAWLLDEDDSLRPVRLEKKAVERTAFSFHPLLLSQGALINKANNQQSAQELLVSNTDETNSLIPSTPQNEYSS